MGSWYSKSPDRPKFFDEDGPFDVYAVCFKKEDKYTIVDALYTTMSLAETHVEALKEKYEYYTIEIVIEKIENPKNLEEIRKNLEEIRKNLEEIRKKLGMDKIESIAQTPDLKPHVWTVLGPII